MPRDAILSDSCTPDRCSVSSQVLIGIGVFHVTTCRPNFVATHAKMLHNVLKQVKTQFSDFCDSSFLRYGRSFNNTEINTNYKHVINRVIASEAKESSRIAREAPTVCIYENRRQRIEFLKNGRRVFG